MALEITGLPIVTSVGDDDLLLIRKGGSIKDSKIAVADFTEGLGNTAVQGFIAVDDGSNKLTLTASNGKDIDKYYNGMRVSFVSPISSTGEVQVKIGNLVYKDIYDYGTTETIVLAANKYYEAVYIGDATNGLFFWTNNFTSTDFVYTSGYKATSTTDDRIDLLPSSSFEVDEYFDGMTIAFVSPIENDGLVKVKINNLEYRDILIYGTTDTIDVTQSEYVEAVYIGDASTGKFYRTNDITQESSVYTNEYIATANIVGTTGPTELSLTSAIGRQKQRYYTGMSLLFTCPVKSIGNVTVDIDSLGPKNLNEGPNDPIANDLIEGQAILAIFDGTQFIKHRFQTINDPLPDLPPVDPADPNDPTPVLPPQYTPTVTVGSGGQYNKIIDAINGLVKEFGEDGGGREATILFKDNYIIKEQIVIKDKNYSWITLKSGNSGVNIDVTEIRVKSLNGFYSFIHSENSKCLKLELKLIKTGSFQNDYKKFYLILVINGEIEINNSTFENIVSNYIIVGYQANINITNTNFVGQVASMNNNTIVMSMIYLSGLTNLTINGGSTSGTWGRGIHSDSTRNTIVLNNFTASNIVFFGFIHNQRGADVIVDNLTIDNTDTIYYDTTHEPQKISFNNVTGTNVSFTGFYIVSTSTVTISNCNVTVTPSGTHTSSLCSVVNITNGSCTIDGCTLKLTNSLTNSATLLYKDTNNNQLSNSRIIPPDNNHKSLFAMRNANILIRDTDLRNSDNSVDNNNIIADNHSTINRSGSVLGGTSTANGGVVN